jgi:zinc/manganese transport system substrate-binding protein
MKNVIQFSLVILGLSLASVPPAQAKLKIFTTATDYADLARQIGGDRVEVHSAMKGPENIHNVMAKPTEMVYLNEADLFVHSGLDTEPWRDNLLKGARNSRVMPDHPGNVDMSVGIELKEVPTGKIDRSMGDVHAYGNGHFTLNPQSAQRMTVTLLKAMVAVDPANAEFYKQNARKLVLDLGTVAKEIKEEFAPFGGLKVVTFHKAWEYFADAIPIDIVGTIEPKPAITPSPAQLQQTIEMIKREGVKVVICETYDDNKLAQYVADQAGAKMIVLPDHVLGMPEADTYQSLFRYDTRKIIEAAKAAGVQPKPEAAHAH